MIFKSYIIENNLENLINFKFILFYGENIGLKRHFKKTLIKQYADTDIISIYQEDLDKNKNLITEEYKKISLFSKKKTIIVNQVSDKLLDTMKYLLENEQETRIILFADLLEKRSKIRTLFEKEKTMAVIPCYEDNEITLKKIITENLKGFKNLNTSIVNMILNYSGLNRNTVLNNLEKIKTFFDNKNLNDNQLESLLNSDKNEKFENIRDAALNQDKNKLNSLINDFNFNNEDVYYYLNNIKQ